MSTPPMTFYNIDNLVPSISYDLGDSKKGNQMLKSVFSSKSVGCLVSSIILNLLFIINFYVGGQWKNLNWSSRAAAEAEAVAAIS